jgi:hypothetical protein
VAGQGGVPRRAKREPPQSVGQRARRLGRDADGFRIACAVQTLLEKGEGYTTVEFKVNLTRPIRRKRAKWCAKAVAHKGRTLAVSEATLKDRTVACFAFGTETCTIFPAERLAR